MWIMWLDVVWEDVENFDFVICGCIEFEIFFVFVDLVLVNVVRMVIGVFMVELFCGVEIDFECIGDGV